MVALSGLTSFYFLNQSRTPARGMLLPAFRVVLHPQLNFPGNTLTDIPGAVSRR